MREWFDLDEEKVCNNPKLSISGIEVIEVSLKHMQRSPLVSSMSCFKNNQMQASNIQKRQIPNTRMSSKKKVLCLLASTSAVLPMRKVLQLAHEETDILYTKYCTPLYLTQTRFNVGMIF